MKIPIKRIIISESANTISGAIKKSLVQIRKPFKQYGSVLPRKPEMDQTDRINSFGSSSSKNLHDKTDHDKTYFDNFLGSLKNDPRPARSKIIRNKNENTD